MANVEGRLAGKVAIVTGAGSSGPGDWEWEGDGYSVRSGGGEGAVG